MGKQNQYIAQLEKLLTHLKNAKLSYLKAADEANASEEKRFLNQEALLRNRFFQEVLSEIQTLGMSYDDLVIGGFNFNQLLISSVDILKNSTLDKCLQSDSILLEIYSKIINDWEYFGKDDPFGDFELLFIVTKNCFKISEIPINYYPRPFGKTKTKIFFHGFKLLKVMIKSHINFKNF